MSAENGLKKLQKESQQNCQSQTLESQNLKEEVLADPSTQTLNVRIVLSDEQFEKLCRLYAEEKVQIPAVNIDLIISTMVHIYLERLNV